MRDGAPLDERVKAALRSRGFVCDRLLVMLLAGPFRREVEPSIEVRRVGDEAMWDEYAAVMDRMSREEPWYSVAVSREIIGSLVSKAQAGVRG